MAQKYLRRDPGRGWKKIRGLSLSVFRVGFQFSVLDQLSWDFDN